MFEIQGKYNKAKIFANTVDATTQGQVIELLNQEFTAESQIRIMPDCHAGAGCVIGTTMTITDKIVPNLVGVDIGCGMEVVELAKGGYDKRTSGAVLDEFIKANIPSGFNKRNNVHAFAEFTNMRELDCIKYLDMAVIEHSLGTLGGGNHFIEIDEDEEGNFYLVIHSGSRNPGLQIANYYQKMAIEALKDSNIPESLRYLKGELFQSYMHDMKIAQDYAYWNRYAMVCDIVLEGLNTTIKNRFVTIHNYVERVDKNKWILRKGAASAYDGEKLIVPMNMRDGSLICIGKGNADWNYSSPHGAGRIMSRGQAKREVSLEDFQQSMNGIYTTSVSSSTLDESPMAYKPMQEIVDNISDTVTIDRIIKPVYNFKA